MVFTVYAGSNGSGKSTLYDTGVDAGEDTRINWDEIALASGEESHAGFNLQSGKKTIRMIRNCLSKRLPFNLEVTLSTTHIFKTINMAKELGYRIVLHYVFLESADLAVSRVANRVAKGGHSVPEKYIRRRYFVSLENLHHALQLCDEAFIYDNSEYHENDDTGFCLAAYFQRGKLLYSDENMPTALAAALKITNK